MNWKDFYKLPLKLDPEPYTSYAWTKDDEMALMFDDDTNREHCQQIIDSINGLGDFKIDRLRVDVVDFYRGDDYPFCVRGYGSLTGIGGHHFSQKKADKIQDDFVEHIMKQLS